MSKAIKEGLLPKLRERYARRGRAGKGRMLDELCEDHGYERKYAIKLLGDAVPAPSGRTASGPGKTDRGAPYPMIRRAAAARALGLNGLVR